jgi:hypothetical protein
MHLTSAWVSAGAHRSRTSTHKESTSCSVHMLLARACAQTHPHTGLPLRMSCHTRIQTRTLRSAIHTHTHKRTSVARCCVQPCTHARARVCAITHVRRHTPPALYVHVMEANRTRIHTHTHTHTHTVAQGQCNHRSDTDTSRSRPTHAVPSSSRRWDCTWSFPQVSSALTL